MSTARAILEMRKAFEVFNLRPPVEIFIDSAQFEKFKEDCNMMTLYGDKNNLKKNQIMFNGIIVTKKECVCGAF